MNKDHNNKVSSDDTDPFFDEDIIELTEIADDIPGDTGTAAPSGGSPAGPEELDTDFIELTEVVDETEQDPDLAFSDSSIDTDLSGRDQSPSVILDTLLEETSKSVAPLEESREDDLLASLGIEMDGLEKFPEEKQEVDLEPPPIDPVLLEKTVKKVLLELFEEKIDKLMTEAVEKALAKEIDSLKESILKEIK